MEHGTVCRSRESIIVLAKYHCHQFWNITRIRWRHQFPTNLPALQHHHTLEFTSKISTMFRQHKKEDNKNKPMEMEMEIFLLLQCFSSESFTVLLYFGGIYSNQYLEYNYKTLLSVDPIDCLHICSCNMSIFSLPTRQYVSIFELQICQYF